MAILTTPLDIYNQCLERFPDTQVDLAPTSTGLIMTLFFSREVAPLRLQSAVITREFVQALNQLFKEVEWAKLVHSKFPSLNPESFDTDIPLEDKQRFQRVMYEKTGRSCVDAIIEYLQSPVDLTTLRKLGLDPDQVEDDGYTENDFAYFRALPDRCKDMPLERQRNIRDSFMRIFPKISHLVMFKIDEEDHARKRAERLKQRAIVVYKPAQDKLQDKPVHQDKPAQVQEVEQKKGNEKSAASCLKWPNSKTVYSSISIVVNIVCMALKTAKGTILIANLPTRIVSVINHRDDYVKIAFEVAAFAALFFPYGPWISIAIDATSEVVNFLRYRSKKFPTLPEVTTMHRPRFEMGPITHAVLRS